MEDINYINKYNLFDNEEGGLEGKQWGNKYTSNGKYDSIQKSFKSEILKLSKANKIILVYPVPEVGGIHSVILFNGQLINL